MSELISGKEALIALANGEEVQQWNGNIFWDIDSNWQVSVFFQEGRKFRLKPRTITINNIEVPAPFEPKHGEIFWHIDVREICSYNYKQEWSDSDEYLKLGAWRTEDEIKQVVAALREVFK